MTYSIRRMEKSDLSQVIEIDRGAFPTQWPPANYRQELNNKLAYYIVASDDSRSVPVTIKKGSPGNLPRLVSRVLPWFGRRPDVNSPPVIEQQFIVGFSGIWLLVDEAHITNIAVRQEYQGKGIGELLLIATIDLSLNLGASLMTLEVRISNTIAQNLYRKYGFIQTGVRRGYYLDNREDAMIMSTENINTTLFLKQLNSLRESLSEKLAANKAD